MTLTDELDQTSQDKSPCQKSYRSEVISFDIYCGNTQTHTYKPTAAAGPRNGRRLLPITLMVQVKQSVGCVCVCVSTTIFDPHAFDLDIWHIGSS